MHNNSWISRLLLVAAIAAPFGFSAGCGGSSGPVELTPTVAMTEAEKQEVEDKREQLGKDEHGEDDR